MGCIMKRLLFLIPLMGISMVAADEAEFLQRIDTARKAKDDKAWTEAIAEWKKAEPKSPEPLIAEANRLFSKSATIRIDAGKPKKGEVEIKDPKTGKTSGRIGPGEPDDKLTGEAINALKEAVVLAPDRLDIRCGMAHLCQESGRFDEELEILKAMTKHALGRPAEQRWIANAELEEPAEKFVPDKLHSYALYYYRQETAEGDKRFGAIAQLTTDAYPNDPVGWNDLALYRHLTLKDTKGAAAALEKAAALDPSDDVVQFNLAKFYSDLGEKKKAKAIYERIAKSSKDKKRVASAKEKLKELGD
jgi:tetratricopeptide (TPR) repeat protein